MNSMMNCLRLNKMECDFIQCGFYDTSYYSNCSVNKTWHVPKCAIKVLIQDSYPPKENFKFDDKLFIIEEVR